MRAFVDWLGSARRRVWPRRTAPFNLDAAASPSWEERAQQAAALLASHVDLVAAVPGRPLRIADFGAGTERLDPILATMLTTPYTYAPFDLIPQSKHVRRLDVRRAFPPEDFDVVFCLGLLEYVEPLPALLERVARRYGMLVASYAIFDAPHPLTPRERRRRGWRSHYSRAELEAEFGRHGLTIEDVAITNGGRTGVWLLRSAVITA